MNERQAALWESIKSFQLDDQKASLSFSSRLCRENGWKVDFAQRAILEYKRFIFLICEAEHPCTPSDEVDQVWHLHLLYTFSYWKELCGKVLKREIHHGPTKGGHSEANKYHDYYQNTLDSYRKFFKKTPPPDLWPSADSRMAFTHFRRVNMHQTWAVKKPSFLWN